jgi:hypothetical protein
MSVGAPLYDDRLYSRTYCSKLFFFSIRLILPAALGPEVYSASNRNEYQKQKNKKAAGA